jgi:hypothetical protein
MEKSGVFFHAMEKVFAIFPRYGKKFSTVWKTFLPGGCGTEARGA